MSPDCDADDESESDNEYNQPTVPAHRTRVERDADEVLSRFG